MVAHMMYTNFIDKIRTKRLIAFHVLVLVILLYFIFHAIAGNRGILAFFKTSQQMEQAAIELDNLRAERIALEHKVNLLKSPLDKDMLDEQARKTLGVAGPNEKVVVVKEE
jgi:cell division protein FtsB